MLFKTSKAFKDGFFAAGDPFSLFNPLHFMRMWTESDYADGIEFAYYAAVNFGEKARPVYIDRKR